jgi:response regulator RpfG family c-di-GMP phosphodiesterase
MYKNGKIKSEVRLMIKGNVLLVDDDKDIVESMEIHLKNEGLKVYKAYDGIEALENSLNFNGYYDAKNGWTKCNIKN